MPHATAGGLRSRKGEVVDFVCQEFGARIIAIDTMAAEPGAAPESMDGCELVCPVCAA